MRMPQCHPGNVEAWPLDGHLYDEAWTRSPTDGEHCEQTLGYLRKCCGQQRNVVQPG